MHLKFQFIVNITRLIHGNTIIFPCNYEVNHLHGKCITMLQLLNISSNNVNSVFFVVTDTKESKLKDSTLCCRLFVTN